MKNKLATILLSLLIAFVLWTYVITVVDKETDTTFYGVPIVLTNESVLTDRGLMVNMDTMPTVTLNLSGNRSDLNKLNAQNITLSVDLSKIYEEGEQLVSYTIYYPYDISGDAFNTVAQPTRVTLNIEKRVSKEVPVQILYDGKVPDDYICDTENPVLDTSVVTVVGPNSVIEQITQAVITVDLTDRVESIVDTFRYTLCNAEGEPVDAQMVTTDVGEINLTLKIQRLKEVPLVLTVLAGGGATEATSQIDIEPQTIRIAGSDAILAEVTEVNLGTVNLADVTESEWTTSFPVKLPEGVTNLTNVEEAKVTVSFPDLRTTTLRLTDIQTVNAPAGLEVELVTQELQVTVRGPKELVDKMKETDLSATVDLTDASLGATTVKANIVIGSGFEAVGAIGSYSVYVTLREAEAENGTDGAGT